ncbi:MAG: Ig-like domain-containing protein [Deltaproteobacteria bacterium]|nr:Ig-like domain-containing protein [Deltaproteobacteria bacterium]
MKKRMVAIVVFLLAGAWLGPSAADARELAREVFDNVAPAAGTGIVPGRDAKGKGWTYVSPGFEVENPASMDLPVSFDNTVRRGAISFDLQRKTGDVPTDYRSVFALKDAAGNNLLLFQLTWSSPFDPRFPAFALKGGEYYSNSLGLWSPWIVLDREVAPGQWIHVDLTWDDAAKLYNLFIDGRSVDAAPKLPDPTTGRNLPDPREEVNRELAARNQPPMFFSRPVGDLLSKVRTIRLGVNSVPEVPGKGTSPLSNAVLSNFVVLVDELPKGLASSRIVSLTDDSFRVMGISKKLVAGDKVSAELVAAPGGKASFGMGIVKGVPMAEVPPSEGGPGIPAVAPGTYRGSYTIKPGDDFEDGRIVGHFVSADNVVAEPVLSASNWTIDTKPVATFAIDRKDLPADSSSKARIKLVAKDANGNAVKGRHFKLTLSTTDEYTGTVGAGDFGQNVGATVETRWRGETDAWGEVEFDYTSGFAAKTVILTAKDLDSGGVSVDYITSFKEASIDIALTPPVSRAALRRGMQYIMKVEASRTELTADGRSRSVIRATLLDPNGKAVAGDPVAFALSSDNGKVNVITGVTDASGVATAEYIAGKKIGIVVVTATATLRGAAASVSITLLADAPAKVYLKARPASLPADGFSRSDIDVKVTDINDNPNKDTKVEFRIAKGGGRLDYPDRVTDNFGDASNRYTAGTVPGIATVVATVRSKVPTDAELAKAKNVLFAPYTPDGDEIRVEKWLKKKGDSFVRGEPLAEYTVGRDRTVRVLAAPYDGTLGDIFVEYWDRAEVGQTLAILVPVSP